MAQAILNAPDISCEHCERTITNTLSPVAGVRSVDVDIPTQQVRGFCNQAGQALPSPARLGERVHRMRRGKADGR